MTKQKHLTIVLGVVLFLLALALTLYPPVSNYVNQRYASEIHTSYQTVMEQTDDTALQAAREKAEAYNASIRPGNSTDSYSQEALMAASDDYESLLNITGDGTIGYVEIPKIHVLLPIYHGTGADSLERGIGHLLGSSLPIGGSSTHSILSGHSGMASQKMFTDLDLLTPGDIFYLQVLQETLVYQVDEIFTVLPHDTSHLGITPGKDYCTLITCVPYGVNSHRLLVRGSRIPYEAAEKVITETMQEEQPKSTWTEKYVMGIAIGLLSALVMVLTYAYSWRIRRTIRIWLQRRKTGGGKYLRRRKNKFRGLVIAFMLFLFLLGLFIFISPYLWGAAVDREIQNNALQFLTLEETESTSPILESAEPTEETIPHAQLREDMNAYNLQLYEQEQSGLTCEEDYRKPSFILANYGLDSEVFGVIRIPAMELSMPIYLGATKQHMADGAAHMSQTSLPIGGINTNCVISGHRGYNGASYFRFIEKLQVGDTVYITNLWEELTYRVTEIKIIEPSEIENILIQDGRDLLTLVTCHPYASGGRQRYLVYCERSADPV